MKKILVLLVVITLIIPGVLAENNTSEIDETIVEEIEGDPGVAPDSPWWNAEVAWDRMRYRWTLNKERKAKLGLEIAEERLLEMQEMSKKGKYKELEVAQSAHDEILDDVEGEILTYIGEGEFTDDPLDTFGGSGVLKIEGMQDLLYFICENGFEHHVAISKSSTSGILYEAFDKYLGWEVYYHNPR